MFFLSAAGCVRFAWKIILIVDIHWQHVSLKFGYICHCNKQFWLMILMKTLRVSLTFSKGHKVSGKQNLFSLFSVIHRFQTDFCWVSEEKPQWYHFQLDFRWLDLSVLENMVEFKLSYSIRKILSLSPLVPIRVLWSAIICEGLICFSFSVSLY